MNFRLAAQILARLFVVLGVAMLPCAAWSASEGDTQSAIALLLAAGICAFTGLMSWAFGRKPDPTLRIRDALFVVTVGWFAAGALSACPYFLSGAIPRFHDAYFEAISGFSTTGSTILQDIEALPAGLHIWRMMTHWLGGIGIVVIFVALFPQLGVGAKHLFKSEVPGPITEGLRPKVKQTALVLTLIYVGLTGSEALLLWGLTPMSAFEAILHSMSTMATGGFSTRNASIAGFQSPSVEWIIILYMYLAGINFALYFSIFTGRGKLLFRNFEWRTYTLIIIATTTVITWLIMPLHGDLYTAGRNALFQVLAIATTTGFGTDDFEVWAPACQVLLLGLMFMGGSAGSTAGGMKTSRIIIMIKSLTNRLRATVTPHAISAVKLGRTPVRSDVIKHTFAFALMWLLTAFTGALCVAAMGVDLMTSVSAAVTCTANVGPGFGAVGPTENFAAIPAAGKYVLTVCMVLGRLEFYTVLALLLPSTWRR